MNEQLQRAIDAAVKGISDEVIGCDFGEMPPDEYDKKRFTTIVTSHIQPEFERLTNRVTELEGICAGLNALDNARKANVERLERELAESKVERLEELRASLAPRLITILRNLTGKGDSNG